MSKVQKQYTLKTKEEIYQKYLQEQITEKELIDGIDAIQSKQVKSGGVVYTPWDIVEAMIRLGEPTLKMSIIEPSCGHGAFLIGLLNYMKSSYSLSGQELFNWFTSKVVGVEISKNTVIELKEILSLYFLKHFKLNISSQSFVNIYNEDGLKFDKKSKFDLCIGNPPYIRAKHLESEYLKYLKENYSSCKKGTIDIYFAFIEKYLKSAQNLVFIVPNSFLTNKAGSVLKEQLIEKLKVLIDFKEKKVFKGASTYTCIFKASPTDTSPTDTSKSDMGNKTETPNTTVVLGECGSTQCSAMCSSTTMMGHSSIGQINCLALDAQKGISSLEEVKKIKKKIFKSNASENEIFKEISVVNNVQERDDWVLYGNELSKMSRITKQQLIKKHLFGSVQAGAKKSTQNNDGQVQNVLSGIATLCDSAYLVKKAKDGKFYAVKDEVCYEIESQMVVPYLKLTKIKSQEDLLNINYMIYPYKEDNDVIHEEELKNKYKLTYKYLLAVKEQLLKRDKGKTQKYESWYAYGRKQGLHKITQSHIIIIPQMIGATCIPRQIDISSLISKFGKIVFTSGFIVLKNKENGQCQNPMDCKISNYLLSKQFLEFAKQNGKAWPGKNECYNSLTIKQIKAIKLPE